MGFRPNTKTWNTGAEHVVANAQERGLNQTDLIERHTIQATNFLRENPNLVPVLKGTGFKDAVLNAKDQLNEARYQVRNNPHYVQILLMISIIRQHLS